MQFETIHFIKSDINRNPYFAILITGTYKIIMVPIRSVFLNGERNERYIIRIVGE